MEKRTCLDFVVNGSIQSTVDDWAQQNSFKLKSQDGNVKTYQKGSGLMVAPMMFLLKTEGEKIHIEAWVRSNLFTRISSLFILPAEIGISSGGFKAVIPRTMARDRVNELLGKIGVPFIK